MLKDYSSGKTKANCFEKKYLLIVSHQLTDMYDAFINLIFFPEMMSYTQKFHRMSVFLFTVFSSHITIQ